MRSSWHVVTVGLLLSALTGCVAAPTYDHPTASIPEKQRDAVECQALAIQGSARAYDYGETARQLMAMCLESRGWQPVRTHRQTGIPIVPSAGDYDAIRACEQNVLYRLHQYEGNATGIESRDWTEALARYRQSRHVQSESELHQAMGRDLGSDRAVCEPPPKG